MTYILIIDGKVAGTTTADDRTGYLKLPAPSGFTPEALADLVYNATTQTLTLAPAAALARAKAARVTGIKAEAARMIAATDWKVDREREREASGLGSRAQIAAILAERESVRRSADAAEVALDALSDIAAVSDFAWSVDIVATIPVPLDEAALIDLCQSAGGMTDAQLVAAFNDPLLAAFWIKLRAASVILPTDQRTLDGLAAVDALSYLPEGAQAVLDAWPMA